MLSGFFKRKDKKARIDDAGRSQDGGSQLSVVSSNESERAVSSESIASSRESQQQADTHSRRQAPTGRLLKSPPPIRGHQPSGILRSPIDRSYSSSSFQSGDAVLPSLTEAMLSSSLVTQPSIIGTKPTVPQLAVRSPSFEAALDRTDVTTAPNLTAQVLVPALAVTSLGLGHSGIIDHSSPLVSSDYVELDNTEMTHQASNQANQSIVQVNEISELTPVTEAIPVPSRAAPPPPMYGLGSSMDSDKEPAPGQDTATQLPNERSPYHEHTTISELSGTAGSLTTDTINTILTMMPFVSTESSKTTLRDSASLPESLSRATTLANDTALNASSQQWDDGWNDAALLKYLDKRSHNDAKDLLLRVHDKHNVPPVANNHPIMMALGYQEKQQQLNNMQGQLDRLLNDWVSKKAQRKARTGHETGVKLARVEALKKRLG